MIKIRSASPQRFAEVILGQAVLWLFLYAAGQLATVEPYIY